MYFFKASFVHLNIVLNVCYYYYGTNQFFICNAFKKKLSLFVLDLQQIPASTVEYLTDLLYNGFYCFEAITERNLDDAICGICGVVGEIYLGDGNEKNCCSRKEVSNSLFLVIFITSSYSSCDGWLIQKV